MLLGLRGQRPLDTVKYPTVHRTGPTTNKHPAQKGGMRWRNLNSAPGISLRSFLLTSSSSFIMVLIPRPLAEMNYSHISGSFQQFPKNVTSLGLCRGWPSCFEHASLPFFSWRTQPSHSFVTPPESWPFRKPHTHGWPPFCAPTETLPPSFTYHTVMRWILFCQDIRVDLALPLIHEFKKME